MTGTSMSPAAATAPSIPGSPPIRPGARRPTTRAGAPPTPAARRPVRLVHLEPAADRRRGAPAGARDQAPAAPSKEQLVNAIPRLERTEFRGFGPGALRFLRRLARHNNRGMVRAATARSTRPRCATRCARWWRRWTSGWPGSRPSSWATRAARSSGSTATSGSPRTSRPTRPTPPASSTITDAGPRGRARTPTGPAAGLYFQLADGECFVAGGIWMPARPALDKIREAIADDPEALDRIVRAPAFRRRFKALTPGGDADAAAARLRRGASRRSGGSGTSRSRPPGMLDGAGGAEPAARRRSSSGTSPRWCRWCGGSTGRSGIGRGSGRY